MPCKENECKCELTQAKLIATGLDIFGNCKNPTCGHPVGNHTDTSAVGVSLSHFFPFLCTFYLFRANRHTKHTAYIEI